MAGRFSSVLPLRITSKHLDYVIVQAIVKLALEGPLKLRMIQVARMQIEIIGVDWDIGILELDDDLDSVAFGPRGEVQQRMLVQAQLSEDALQAGGRRIGH